MVVWKILGFEEFLRIEFRDIWVNLRIILSFKDVKNFKCFFCCLERIRSIIILVSEISNDRICMEERSVD